MRPLVFLGETFTNDEEFRRRYPAYANYIAIVRDGADTPHKVEIVLHRKAKRGKKGKPRIGHVKRKRAA